MLHYARAVVLAVLCTGALVASAQAEPSDRYLEGYAAAILERDLGLVIAELSVEEGRALVVVRELRNVSPERIAAVLVRIEGIDRVEVSVAGEEVDALAETSEDDSGIDVMPRIEIFEPLLADPRQPHFSASFLWYLGDPELGHVGSANFGETIALLGGEVGDGRWELGVLGGVFSIFDLDAASQDLVNSDFWVAPTVSLARGVLSGQIRLYHQSSHLGDEFLLRNRTQRINLSYEGLDLLLSADVHPTLRLYGGVGRIIRSDNDLHPLSAQGGLEWKSRLPFPIDVAWPVAAADFQFREENDWNEEISVRAGFQFENAALSRARIQILFEYFLGNSPNGQFFARRIEYLGVGAHLHL